MKTLTVYQPWASLIMLGAKPFEFRHWDYTSRYAGLLNQRIVIHASARKIMPDEIEDILERMAAGESSLKDDIARPVLERLRSAYKGKGVLELAAGLGTAILGGRGGSGKTWLTKSENAPVDATKAIVLNSDDFKEALPEYHGWNAGLLHEEATDILNRSLDLAKRMGVNIVLDATMKSEGGIGRYVADFREAGYNLEGYYMHASPETAATRAVERFLRGGDKGRYVPPELILSSTTNEKVFDKVSQFMRKWAIYDNNTGGGSAPKFVAKGENKLDE